jgi:hypothetical protein
MISLLKWDSFLKKEGNRQKGAKEASIDPWTIFL